MRRKISRRLVWVSLIFGLALLYTAGRIRVIELGYEVSHLQGVVDQMERENNLMRSRVVEARSTAKLAAWAKRFGFFPPEGDRLVILEEK